MESGPKCSHKTKETNENHQSIIDLVLFVITLCIGCTGPRIILFPDGSEPLREMTLEGDGDGKVQVISISGFIADKPRGRALSTRPSVVQEVVSHLRLAEKDDDVKAVLLKVDSPGGTITASDIIYHQLMDFKTRTGKKVVVCMMNVAASGGYYVSLPADTIVAHPTTITGSVGAVLMQPEVWGLMEKIGMGMRVNKSGENKDMGSPFRSMTAVEDNMLQDLIDALGGRFVGLVNQHRKLNAEQLKAVADARIFLADDALALGLIDKIGYLHDAVAEAKGLAGLDDDARVVTYRRTDYPDDNLYNTLSGSSQRVPTALVDMGAFNDLMALEAGFYYLWPQALGDRYR